MFFALGSLPLAIVALVYFINHRYSGLPLWDVRGVDGVHTLVWVLNFISFLFLYPSTFNILEVAAVGEWLMVFNMFYPFSPHIFCFKLDRVQGLLP